MISLFHLFLLPFIILIVFLSLSCSPYLFLFILLFIFPTYLCSPFFLHPFFSVFLHPSLVKIILFPSIYLFFVCFPFNFFYSFLFSIYFFFSLLFPTYFSYFPTLLTCSSLHLLFIFYHFFFFIYLSSSFVIFLSPSLPLFFFTPLLLKSHYFPSFSSSLSVFPFKTPLLILLFHFFLSHFFLFIIAFLFLSHSLYLSLFIPISSFLSLFNFYIFFPYPSPFSLSSLSICFHFIFIVDLFFLSHLLT